MLEKLTYASKEDQEKFENKYGNYNTAPEGFREITEAQFAEGDFFSQCITHMEHRQLLNVPGEPYVLTVRMFYMPDGTGYAMSYKPDEHHYDKGVRVVDVPAKIRYFAFGCDHDYKALSQEECADEGIKHWGQCWHVNKCVKCGSIWSYDSSD